MSLFDAFVIFDLVSDLEDASPTPNMPCKGNCPSAYIQNLAGCDAATGECICQHGYAMLGGACTGKLNHENIHVCMVNCKCSWIYFNCCFKYYGEVGSQCEGNWTDTVFCPK